MTTDQAENNSPPQMTGPAKIPIELKLQSIPSRIPNSRTGEMAPQLAATRVIHAPLPKP
jgi:hypothetical protein